jgi:hypothetical protein
VETTQPAGGAVETEAVRHRHYAHRVRLAGFGAVGVSARAADGR